MKVNQVAMPHAADGIVVSPKPSHQPVELKIGDDIVVHRIPDGDSFVEVKAWTCLDEGYLEQIACSPGTREHESLLVVKAKPSQVHMALVAAEFKFGAPGQWTYENRKIGAVAPTGDAIDVRVRYLDREGKLVERPIREWIRRAVSRDEEAQSQKERAFPKLPWIFGGSYFAANRHPMPPGEHYVADLTGSLIGLVTFGDEMIGFSRVLSDQEDVQPQEWEVNTEKVPPMDTEVTLVLRRWRDE